MANAIYQHLKKKEMRLRGQDASSPFRASVHHRPWLNQSNTTHLLVPLRGMHPLQRKEHWFEVSLYLWSRQAIDMASVGKRQFIGRAYRARHAVHIEEQFIVIWKFQQVINLIKQLDSDFLSITFCIS
jgi:hypothetical protein